MYRTLPDSLQSRGPEAFALEAKLVLEVTVTEETIGDRKNSVVLDDPSNYTWFLHVSSRLEKSGYDRAHSGDCSGVEEVFLRRNDAKSALYMPPNQKGKQGVFPTSH